MSAPYKDEFYELYGNYLRETAVRTNHNFVFGIFARMAQMTDLFVVDFGCGLGEYAMFGQFKDYAGVDANEAGQVRNFFRTDYHNFGFVPHLPFVPTAFVSLFSIECCHGASEKYALYNRIFSEIPSITLGLSGGFFYENRKFEEKVGEAGGIESYQTIEDPAVHVSEVFSELRTCMKTPSAMFGRDVVEVWKFFIRRGASPKLRV